MSIDKDDRQTLQDELDATKREAVRAKHAAEVEHGLRADINTRSANDAEPERRGWLQRIKAFFIGI